ncbi:ATP-binding cassette domain-containing protein [Campylobacter suis]|uniref:Phosphonates utilization ATP-binding protein PhnK n=1 Tax=Campylobacter suis TaxID=2790657 RepID=A0ABM8Q8Q3_9BACT|nr:ATP-binding cassette domain-containing protein [Campylobacter suis]CAD7289335.1 Putative phosphonates utilization ATP-binding protein PhnK [Campylobacter suis]
MVLKINNLSKIFGSGCPKCLSKTGASKNSSICPECGSVVGVNSVSLQLKKGEVLGIVGESGSGKSTLLQLIYQDLKTTFGEIFVENFSDKNGRLKNIFEANLNELNLLKNKTMSMIYQNPRLGLNYNFSAGGNIAEKIIASGEKRYHSIRQGALMFLEKTEIPTQRIDDYPDAFSGGQQQRIQISKALSANPKILLLDEPTTGLDLSVQAKILDLIKALQKQIGFAMIIVSHDLGVIKHLTDLTVVMKNGEVVEMGLTDQILQDPQHPYTQLLVSSVL